MEKTLLVIVIFFLYIGNFKATTYTYFVDYTLGNDSNSGTSDTSPWKTIDKVNAASAINGWLNPGDQVLFKRGCTWTLSIAPLLPNRSGNSNSPIIYGAYGSGNKPVIDGNNLVEYCINIATPGDYTHSPAYNYIQIQDMKFIHGGGYNVNIWNCSHISIIDCDMDSNYGLLSSTGKSVNIYIGQGADVIVDHCTITNTAIINSGISGEGIYLDGVDNARVENTIFDGGKSGIRIGFGNPATGWSDWTDNPIIRYCTVMNQSYDLIDDDGSNNGQFYYNLFDIGTMADENEGVYIYSDGSGDYPQYSAINSNYYNNTFVNHSVKGTAFLVSPGVHSTGIVLKNNIFYNANYANWFFYSDDTYGTVSFNKNLYYLPSENYDHSWRIKHNNVNSTASNFATWKSWGYDSHSSTNNPSFSDFNGGNYSLYDNSPAVLSGVWLNLPARDLMGNQIGNPPDIGAYQNSTYWEGTISTTQTISGNVAITGDVTIPSGVTLTISPETNIKLENGANITSHGIISCPHNSNQGNITIDTILMGYYNSNGWISFDGSNSSNSVFQFVTLKNTEGIQCINGADVHINDCILQKSVEGIYFNNSEPIIVNNIIDDPQLNGISGEASGQYPLIQGNIITRTSDLNNFQGIILGNNTRPTIMSNVIHGFCWGIYLGGNCITNTGYDMGTCNNNITDNFYGVGTGWGSITNWGEDDGSGMNNSTWGNTRDDAYTYQHGELYSYYAHWGLNRYVDGTSTMEMYYNNPNDPCAGSEQNITNNATTNNSQSTAETDNFLAGLRLEKQGKIDEAITFYRNLILNDDHTIFALTNLMSFNNKYSKPEILNYFNGILSGHSKYYGQVKKLLGDYLIQNNQFDNAIIAYNDAITNASTQYDGISAKFEKLFAYLHVKNDLATASKILSDIKGMNSKDEEIQMRTKIAENLIYRSNNVMHKSVLISGSNVPTTYELSQNFPNPFNPLTTIRYQIPKPGMVTLKVYDILGREITTLVNENKIEGTYDFTFSASRFPSGVYIYQLKINDYVSSKKMVLLK